MPRNRGFVTIPFALLCACCGIASVGSAQNIGTSMEVLESASADPAEPGGLAPGEVTANPGDAVTVPPASGAQLRITFNVETMVSLPPSVALLHSDGTELPVTLLCAQEATADHPTPSNFVCDAGYLADPANGTERWIYIGMQIGAGATEGIPAGTYTAEVTVMLAI